MSQEDLLKQQRILSGCLIRREMRECGIWGPMLKLDGTPLEEDLLAAFPDSIEAFEGSTYADLVPLLDAYGLRTYVGMPTKAAKALLYRFITGRARAPGTSPDAPPAASTLHTKDKAGTKTGGGVSPVPWNWVFVVFLGYVAWMLFVGVLVWSVQSQRAMACQCPVSQSLSWSL